MSAIAGLRERFSLLFELFRFMNNRKRWWLWPLIVAFAAMALVVAVAEIPAFAPFIYALF